MNNNDFNNSYSNFHYNNDLDQVPQNDFNHFGNDRYYRDVDNRLFFDFFFVFRQLPSVNVEECFCDTSVVR